MEAHKQQVIPKGKNRGGAADASYSVCRGHLFSDVNGIKTADWDHFLQMLTSSAR